MADVIPFPPAASSVESEQPSAAPTQVQPSTTVQPATTAREAIGRVLRTERADQERSLANVAEDANVSLPYLSEVERGRKEVSSELLAAICGALDIEVADALEAAAQQMRPGHMMISSNNRFETQLLAA